MLTQSEVDEAMQLLMAIREAQRDLSGGTKVKIEITYSGVKTYIVSPDFPRRHNQRVNEGCGLSVDISRATRIAMGKDDG